ncbi:uncharacterized protein MKK02DRAFT_42307 [Dioszegia hungarica]|uniref:Uncharacterized protein n=1 Tax=Dioszegia hungarica TaxID=4972 RepID=A0AA38HB74_9TREE|nr:uncharacterized protein MKK02DRAFT_42307 [Dioszegia hungarica]KAI9637928.1 hypothetical protein MKK02DRAFT_42307 [Dioszegia hungarica]
MPSRPALFVMLFSAILFYFSFPSLQVEFRKAYGVDLTWDEIKKIDVLEVDWPFVLRQRGGEAIKEVRKRYEL